MSNRKRRNNGNDNNGQSFRIGTCPICGKENVPLSEHHIYKKAVYGDSDRKFSLCRDCHDVIEFMNRTWENMTLRPFIRIYREIFNAFCKGEINGFKISLTEKMDEEELIKALTPTVVRGFQRIERKGVNPWLENRIVKKGISIIPKKKKDNGQ